MMHWHKARIGTGTPAAVVSVPLLIVFLFAFLLAGCEKGDYRTFLKGRKNVIHGKYQEAIVTLENYLEENKSGEHVSRAYLFLGKAHVGLKQYDQARHIFLKLNDRYPRTLEGYKALYKIAEIELALGRKEEALKWYSKLAKDKSGPLTAEAEMFESLLKVI